MRTIALIAVLALPLAACNQAPDVPEGAVYTAPVVTKLSSTNTSEEPAILAGYNGEKRFESEYTGVDRTRVLAMSAAGMGQKVTVEEALNGAYK